MRAVFDTNVLVSAFITRRNAPHVLLRASEDGEFDLVTTETLLSELEGVLRRARWARYPFTQDDLALYVVGLREQALLVEPRAQITAVDRDPDDNRVLEAAVAGEADYIVTGDKDLLDLREYRGIAILRPAEFLALLRSGGP